MYASIRLTMVMSLLLSAFYLFSSADTALGRAGTISVSNSSIAVRPPASLLAPLSGPNCLVYPFATHETTVTGATPGQKIDIFNGAADLGIVAGANDLGWVSWNPDFTTGAASDFYLENELTNPQLSLNDYTNARDSGDHILGLDDWVASMQGDKARVEASEGLVSALIGQEIIIPVWETFDQGLADEVNAYHIVNFALVRIEDPADIDLPNKTVLAVYIGEVTRELCHPYLVITKSGPLTATIGSPITYTLTLTNSGNLTATNLSITDVIPSNAGYLSGGTLVSNTVVWTVPRLTYSNTLTRMFSVLANQTITNSEYSVSADNNISTTGTISVVTTISGTQIYLPLILKD